MRIVYIASAIILNIVLQSTIFPYIQVFGIKPNTSLILIVSYAILRGDLEGSIFGFFSGLVQDLMFGNMIGLYALLGFLTGYVCGKPFKDFYRENYLITIFTVGISSIVYSLVFYFLYFLFRGEVDIVYYFARIILPEAGYTLFLSIPIYRLMYSINFYIENEERYSRRLF